jgi:hypothetical protein
MYESFTDIELIARHRIAERVRYSPRAPRRQDFMATPRRQ